MTKILTQKPAETLRSGKGSNEVATNCKKVAEALIKLREARDLFKAAGAARTLKRVRAALKSAEGAERHAQCMHSRAQVVV